MLLLTTKGLVVIFLTLVRYKRPILLGDYVVSCSEWDYIGWSDLKERPLLCI